MKNASYSTIQNNNIADKDFDFFKNVKMFVIQQIYADKPMLIPSISLYYLQPRDF